MKKKSFWGQIWSGVLRTLADSLRRLLIMMIGFLLLVLLAMIPTTAQDSQNFIDAASGVRYRVSYYVGANFPVGMVFAPDGRLFYNEKITGNVRVVSADGELQPEPVIHLPTNALQERGMLGLALDPDFENNHYVYVVHTAAGTERDWPANNLVRFREEDGIGYEPEILLSVPIDNGNLLHNGGNVHFDDEGYLYITFGDYGEPANSQNLDTMQGAMHRFEVTEDGLIPAEGNPFGDDNSTYAYGLRNPFDFTFDPMTGNIFATEVGPSCDDEIDLILPGFNYGWREDYECVGKDLIPGLDLYAPPLLTYTPVEAPTGIIIYDHPAIPEWQGDLFFCNWIFGTMRRVELNEGRTRVEAVHEIDLGDVQCRVDLTVGPDGGIYFGTVGESRGAIYRILPL